MPTKEYFARHPPFPSDVPVVQLECLSFTKIFARDAAECERLFQACQDIGFFLLNLRGTEEGETMLKHAETAFTLTEQIHELDQDELKRYAFKPPADLFGYGWFAPTHHWMHLFLYYLPTVHIHTHLSSKSQADWDTLATNLSAT